MAVRDIALIGLMAAVLSVGKIMLNAIANIEVVTLLIMVYTLTLGWKRTALATVVFSIIEVLQWGLHTWTVMYLVLWPLLAVLTAVTAHPLRLVHLATGRGLAKVSAKLGAAYTNSRVQPLYALFAGAWGFAFGFLCAVISAVFYAGSRGRLAYMMLYWGSGLSFDIVHAAGNLVINLALFGPLIWLFDKCHKSLNL